MFVLILKVIQNLSMYVFFGAPVFLYLLWPPATGRIISEHRSVDGAVEAHAEKGLAVGAVGFVLSGVAVSLLSGTFGWLVVLQAALALGAWAAWRQGRGLAVWIGTVLGVGLVAVVSFTRGSVEGGAFPVVSHAVHLAASVLWAGGLLYLAALPWSGGMNVVRSPRSPAALLDRFTYVAFGAVALVALTGAVASYVNVYTPAALGRTTYGLTLAVKIGLFLTLLLVGTVNFLVVAPRLRAGNSFGQHDGKAVKRVGTVLRIEAFLVVGILAVTGLLSSLPSGDGLSQLAAGRWELALGTGSVVAEMAPGDVPGALQLDLYVADGQGGPAADVEEIVVAMEMPAHSMGLRPMTAETVGSGHYRVHPLLSMEGEWETYITATFANGEQAVAAFAFEAFEAARSLGMTRRLEPRAIFFEFAAERADAALDEDYVFSMRDFLQDLIFSLDPRPMYFISGAFWFVAALFVVIAALRGAFPRWVAPLGMVALAVGGFFLLSSMLVNAYPTTYAKNPVPFTAASVDEGYKLYLAHCSVCHGMQGHGDGPMAPFLDPPPEDLRVRHIDAHPDGELFWWFTYGIPGSDMPGNEATMTESERWHVVNFVRSLHRPVPGAGATDQFISE